MRTRVMLVFVLLSASSAPGLAAASDQDGAAAPKFHRLDLSNQPAIAPGLIGAVRGEVDSAGERIVVSDLSVMQPVAVALLAADPDRPLQLEVVKEAWDQRVRSERTDAQGHVRLQFRTQESFGLLVSSTSDERAKYSLLVWAGSEPTVQPRSIFAGARGESSRSDSAAAPATSATRDANGLLLAAGLVVVLGGAAFWFFAKRRRNA